MYSSVLRIVLVSLALAHVASASKAATKNNLIQKVCNTTLYKDLCISTLQADPDSASADVKGLATIALQAASDYATNISSLLKEKAGATEDPFLQQCYSDCTENFQDAIDQLHDSFAALDSKSYNDLNTWVTAAMSDAETCEDGFSEQPGSETTTVEKAQTFSKLCSNVLAITKQLEA